jgi:hypothetical protein
MVILTDGDASSSVGIAFALLASFLSESVNDIPGLRGVGFREDCERVALNRSVSRGGDPLSDGDVDNKPYDYQLPNFI